MTIQATLFLATIPFQATTPPPPSCDPILAKLDYPTLARMAHVSGTVVATFRVDSLGHPAEVQLTGHPLLQTGVTQALAATGFPSGCANLTLKIDVAFHYKVVPRAPDPNKVTRTSAWSYDVFTEENSKDFNPTMPSQAVLPARRTPTLESQLARSLVGTSILTLLLLTGVAVLFRTRGTLRYLFRMTPATAADLPDWALRARDPDRWDNILVHAVIGAVATAMASVGLLFTVWSHWQGFILWPIGTAAVLLGMKPLWLDSYLAVALPRWTKEQWHNKPFSISIPIALLLILAGLAIYAVIPLPGAYERN